MTTYLKFTKDFANQLKDLKNKDPNTSIVIHSARIEIGLENPTSEHLDMAMNRLGMYSDYNFYTYNGLFIYDGGV